MRIPILFLHAIFVTQFRVENIKVCKNYAKCPEKDTPPPLSIPKPMIDSVKHSKWLAILTLPISLLY